MKTLSNFIIFILLVNIVFLLWGAKDMCKQGLKEYLEDFKPQVIK